jgi:hypothetical protein
MFLSRRQISYIILPHVEEEPEEELEEELDFHVGDEVLVDKCDICIPTDSFITFGHVKD